ncbi:MAG: molecular chaperone HtpG [Clostridia bacterium]|nr:molecular chaperone HtpG [Clostridia bacterium]
MKKKQFKTESKKLLDMMINSIYTHKEIFLRELISNASDALDKLYFRSLTDSSIQVGKSDLAISISYNKELRTLTVSDNGCGMTEEELESNLGTIAKSGSFDFKKDNDQGEEIDVIGQFGVGFYSAFMVADKITVKSRLYGDTVAHVWESEGAEGYHIGECEKESFGTEIILKIKDDSEEEKYSEFLDEYRLRALVKKYSDYIRYPIKMSVTKSRKKDDSEEYESYTEIETLNSMIPLWKKNRSEVEIEEYNNFYTDKYYDYQPPLRVITQKSEGTATYNALLFIPAHAPFNYYTQDFEKGLELYSSGVMIMENCKDLLPDYFGFVRGIVDSSDLSLNISREMLQHDRQLKVMAKAIEKKIKNELASMMEGDREKYEKFFDEFGIQLKYGVYSDYGMHKELLQDLLLFKSSAEKKYISLKQYVEGMKDEQEFIYYASGESIDKIEMLPKVETAKSRGYEILYLTDDVDEFALRVLENYEGKEFKNVTADLGQTEDEDSKENIKSENEKNEMMLNLMKDAVGGLSAVRFTSSLGHHAVCLTTEGDISAEMEKVLRKMPGAEAGIPSAKMIMEINVNHPIKTKLIELYLSDEEKLKKYAKLLYAQGRLIGGMTVENPAELCELMEELMI